MHSLLTPSRRVPRPLLPQMGKMTGCSDFAVATNGAADAAAKASLMAAQAAGAAGTASGAATQAYIEHIFITASIPEAELANELSDELMHATGAQPAISSKKKNRGG